MQTLCGCIIAQLCVVRLIINVGILATAADDASHGLEVLVFDDYYCCGYDSWDGVYN